MNKYYRMGVKAHSNGQGSAFAAAWAASELVGNYKGEVRTFATDCKVAPSTVYEWAQGYLLYSWMREKFTDDRKFQELRTVRKGLSLSHFIKMAALWHKYELDIYYVWAQLETAWAEQISARSMDINCRHELEANTDYDNSIPVQQAALALQSAIRDAWGLE